MNTNPKAKRVLCYGDSITNGYDPEIDTRLDVSKRWTGVLQNLLGNEYEIIEEGLGGRTTNLDDPKSLNRNGLDYFSACIGSHLPLDIVVILLGTNNLKERFSQASAQIAQSLIKYIQLIKDCCTEDEYSLPRIILISPPAIIGKFIPRDWDFNGAEAKFNQLASMYKQVANENNVEFIYLSTILPSKKDGVHLNESGNKQLADMIHKYICKY